MADQPEGPLLTDANADFDADALNGVFIDEGKGGGKISASYYMELAKTGEDLTAVRSLSLTRAGGGLDASEYFNRKAYLSDPKHAQMGRGMLNPFLHEHQADITDEPDGTNLNRRPLMTPLPGFPIDELVNLPRFIMEDLSPFAFVNEPQYVPENLQMPYPKILFELGPEDDKHLIVVRQAGFAQAIAFEYLHTDRTVPFMIGSMAHAEVNKDGTMDIMIMPYSTDKELAHRCVHAVIGFIAEFSVGNTIIGTQPRPKNPDVPPVKEGRKFRIVRVITGVKTIAKPWQGGTHASPREHERCGHWRRVKGERRWFPAVTVNKGVIGRVDKAYYVSKKAQPATPDLKDKDLS
jgi:hypothetical protein